MQTSQDLIVNSRRLTYRYKDSLLFQDRLLADNQQKRIITVDTGKELYLDSKCRMQGKYQLTTTGASQYFKGVSDGLYQVVRKLIADDHPDIKARETPRVISNLVNRLIAHRAPLLNGCRVICCDERLQVDGFVSGRYVMIPNERVYQHFRDACELMRFPMQFYGGDLSGREMTVTVISKKAIERAFGNIYLGAVCQNGETIGRAIRMSIIVLDSVTRSWSVADFEKDLRIAHMHSRTLRDKVMRIGDLLGSYQREVEKKLDLLTVSANTPISTNWDEGRLRKLRSRLLTLGDDLYLQSRSIDAVLEILPPPDPSRKVTPPTKWDLYSACLSIADSVPVGRSLPLRQLGYRVIFG